MAQKIAILGLGLIGGSLARSLKRLPDPPYIIGYDSDLDSCAEALARGAIDAVADNPAAAVSEVEIAVIAVVIGAGEQILREMLPGLGPTTVVTDVGSVKQPVTDAARAILGGHFHNFVPGHPIAGSERSGFAAATATMYDGCTVVLTPEEETSADAVAKVEAMWQATGAARVIAMSTQLHDRRLAATSHLPHVIAFALVEALSKLETDEDIFLLAGGGFADLSRIAASSPPLWRDICLSNRTELLKVLDRFCSELQTARAALAEDDGRTLEEMFAHASEIRTRFRDTRRS